MNLQECGNVWSKSFGLTNVAGENVVCPELLSLGTSTFMKCGFFKLFLQCHLSENFSKKLHCIVVWEAEEKDHGEGEYRKTKRKKKEKKQGMEINTRERLESGRKSMKRS